MVLLIFVKGKPLVSSGNLVAARPLLVNAWFVYMVSTSGELKLNYDGKMKDLLSLSPNESRETRRRVQMIFQDPYSALNPTQKYFRGNLTSLCVYSAWEHQMSGKKKSFKC